MGFLDDVFNALQKPQGVVTGAFAGLGNTIGRVVNPGAQEDEVELTRIFRDLDEAGVDTSEWEHLRPRAQTILGGIKEGWNNEVGPGKIFSQQSRSVEDWDKPQSMGSSALGLAGDVVMDPLAALGATGAVGKAAKLARVPGAEGLAQGVNTFGKLPEGSGLAARAGQLGRRATQGVLATGSGTGALLGPLIGFGESGAQRAAAKWGPAIARRMGLVKDGSAVGNVSNAVDEGAGLAEPLALSPGPALRNRPTSGPVVEPSGSPWEAGPIPMRELGPGPGRVFEGGPVGSTGLGREQLSELQQWLQNQTPALPRASAIPLPPAYSTGELPELLRKEAARLKAARAAKTQPKPRLNDDQLVEEILRLTGTSRFG